MLTDRIAANIAKELEGTATPSGIAAADRAAEAAMTSAQLSELDMHFQLEQASESGDFKLLTAQERRIASRRASFVAYKLSEGGDSFYELAARNDAALAEIREIRDSARSVGARTAALGQRPVPVRAHPTEDELDALHQELFADVDPAAFS